MEDKRQDSLQKEPGRDHQSYGNKFDLLNLQWIYRSKQYYHMTAADIYALLIPVNYKLHKKDIAALVEAETMTAFESLLDRTYYGRRYEKLELTYA